MFIPMKCIYFTMKIRKHNRNIALRIKKFIWVNHCYMSAFKLLYLLYLFVLHTTSSIYLNRTIIIT